MAARKTARKKRPDPWERPSPLPLTIWPLRTLTLAAISVLAIWMLIPNLEYLVILFRARSFGELDRLARCAAAFVSSLALLHITLLLDQVLTSPWHIGEWARRRYGVVLPKASCAALMRALRDRKAARIDVPGTSISPGDEPNLEAHVTRGDEGVRRLTLHDPATGIEIPLRPPWSPPVSIDIDALDRTR